MYLQHRSTLNLSSPGRKNVQKATMDTPNQKVRPLWEAVRAVLGHCPLATASPTGGNGRMARFLMNVLLASGGYL
jgi:hypothetical protein